MDDLVQLQVGDEPAFVGQVERENRVGPAVLPERLVDKVSSVPMSINRRIFRAATIVTLASVLVKLVATFKEFFVAGVFGRNDGMDAFLIAFLVPGLLVNLFSESMNQALIPTFIRVRQEFGFASAQRLLSSAMAWTCMLLAAGSLVAGLFAHLLLPSLVSHFSAAKLQLTEHLFYAMLPIVLIAGIAQNATAVLNASERFAWPALLPMATPVVIVAIVWLLAPRLAAPYNIWALAVGNLAGALLHAVLLLAMMRRHGYSFRLRWHSKDLALAPARREVAGQYGPILLSGLVSSAGLLVDQGMAATLPAGSVATLVYANRFVSVLLNLLAGAIATAITPYFSELVSRKDWAGCRHTLNTWVRITALISVPICLCMVFASSWLIRLTFQHGAFTSSDTGEVAPVQAMYALQLPFYVVSRVFYRYLVTIRRTSLIFYCGMINLFLDVILNIVLIRRFGVAGIALATSLWTVSTFLFLCFWAYRLLPQTPDSGLEEELV